MVVGHEAAASWGWFGGPQRPGQGVCFPDGKSSSWKTGSCICTKLKQHPGDYWSLWNNPEPFWELVNVSWRRRGKAESWGPVWPPPSCIWVLCHSTHSGGVWLWHLHYWDPGKTPPKWSPLTRVSRNDFMSFLFVLCFPPERNIFLKPVIQYNLLVEVVRLISIANNWE